MEGNVTRAFMTAFMTGCVVAMAGCSAGGKPGAPQPARPIDITRFYTGRWYEIGRTPMKLTDGCVAGTTDYFRRPDGQLMDRDACRTGTPEGAERRYQGPVTILDPGINAKVSVRYTVWGFWPVWRTYWMLDRGEDYRWFIVSDPSFRNLSLFTRTPRPTPAEIDALSARARALGYDTRKLEYPTPFPPGEP
jgi:apolipoprotein D and lipocalin family protein